LTVALHQMAHGGQITDAFRAAGALYLSWQRWAHSALPDVLGPRNPRHVRQSQGR
jgi:hypothetical protein